MIKYDLTKKLERILQEKHELPSFSLEIPNNLDFGDYATNISFLLAKSLKKSPKIIAEELSTELSNHPELKDNYEFTPTGGFINIKLKDSELWDYFCNLDKTKDIFPQYNRKILLEFVSANPTGPLHIGHGRWAAVGDVIRALYAFIGTDISTEFYVNDAGNQIENLRKTIKAVQAGKPVPPDGYHGHYIQDLAKSTKDPVQVMKETQKKTLENFRVKFNTWFSELSIHEKDEVNEAIAILEEQGLTYEKEGALWFKSSNFGDEKDRVLIKADQKFTYFAVDIAYHLDKLKRGFTHLINIWGADHHGYVQRVKSAVKAVSKGRFDTDHEFDIIIGQLVSLFRKGEPVRMSKRTGDMITLSEVIEEIGTDATRFFLIHKSTDTHLDFDLALAKKKSNENPVYYIQYCHARICSIFRKLEIDPKDIPEKIDQVQLEKPERNLIYETNQVYDVIYESALNCTPHKFANYCLSLAKVFHTFYEKCPIIKADQATQEKRLYIIKKFQKTLQTCLEILGISAPEAM